MCGKTEKMDSQIKVGGEGGRASKFAPEIKYTAFEADPRVNQKQKVFGKEKGKIKKYKQEDHTERHFTQSRERESMWKGKEIRKIDTKTILKCRKSTQKNNFALMRESIG